MGVTTDDESRKRCYDRPKNQVAIVAILVLVAAGLTIAAVLSLDSDGRGGDPLSGLDNTENNFDTFDGPTSVPTSSPISSPSVSPSPQPSNDPTISPSTNPSLAPSDPPSGGPTTNPTVNPTDAPTSGPTLSPTELYVEPNPVPDNPPRGYFNYDPDDTRYGPSAWHRVDTRNHFLREFDSDGFGPYRGHLSSSDPTQNRCGGPDRKQSPKNLVRTTACEAHHEIRTRCGTQPVSSPLFQRLILPHKLSLVMNRRPCLDPDDEDCSVRRPPIADYPRYSSSLTPFSDLLNLDIKVPGEHTLEGESFDAEIQMLHTHLDPDPPRVSSIGIPIRATENGYNLEFQFLLEQFQEEYDEHARECELSRRNLRSEPTKTYSNVTRTARDLQFQRFDPYSEAFMPDIFFYRYDGSITEPPCKDITWWVMIAPMIISFEQLHQIKTILFTHVNGNCEKTSVHNARQEVTRPIQPLGDDREIEKCQPGAFESDVEKGKDHNGNRCP